MSTTKSTFANLIVVLPQKDLFDLFMLVKLNNNCALSFSFPEVTASLKI